MGFATVGEKSSPTMWEDLLVHLGEHLELSASALVLAVLVGVPLGIAAAEFRRWRFPVLALASIGRTLPSLAVLTLLLPWLGVGIRPAVVALAILAVATILINVELAIRSVGVASLDAASGLGMNRIQCFVRVVVPAALPVAFAGIRTAATEVIASATLATFIGGGGLGDDIVRGLQTDNVPVLLAGAATVALLAIAVEALFSLFARRLDAA